MVPQFPVESQSLLEYPYCPDGQLTIEAVTPALVWGNPLSAGQYGIQLDAVWLPAEEVLLRGQFWQLFITDCQFPDASQYLVELPY